MSKIKEQLIEDEERASVLRSNVDLIDEQIAVLEQARDVLSEILANGENTSALFESDCIDACTYLKHVIEGLS